MLNFYWIWVSVPNSPLSLFLDSLTFVSCSALLFTVLSYPLLIFVALSFFPTCQSLFLSCCHSSVLLPLCPFTCQQSASIFIPPYHPSAQLRPLCLYLDSTVLSFFLQTFFFRLSTCIGSGPHHILQPSKPFQYSLIQFHRKCPLKDLVRTESLHGFFCQNREGKVRRVEPFDTDHS